MCEIPSKIPISLAKKSGLTLVLKILIFLIVSLITYAFLLSLGISDVSNQS
jgi:CHASE3 domain sensor protein